MRYDSYFFDKTDQRLIACKRRKINDMHAVYIRIGVYAYSEIDIAGRKYLCWNQRM